MKTIYFKSTGQGNLFSKLEHKIFENNTCIISRLQSRTLTGRNLQIQVHQHFRYRLHMVWKIHYKKEPTQGCLQGIIPMRDEMNKFLLELINGGSENVFNCVGETFPEILQGKVEECFRARTAKRDLSLISRSLIRDYQECDKLRFWFTCYTYSSHVYGLNWEVPF
jgi:hypothetical protein